MNYPIKMISSEGDVIVEFISEHEGIYIKSGHDTEIFGSKYDVGTTHYDFISCKDTERWSVYKEPINEDIDRIRGNGGSTSYYDIPIGATDLGHLIKHKKMEHGIGEAFCALYRLNDNGEYKRNLTKAKYYIEKELEWLEKCHQE